MSEPRRGGNLETSLQGSLKLDPNAILQEGWNLTKRTYGVLFGAVIVTAIVAAVAMLLLTLLAQLMGLEQGGEQLQMMVLLIQLLVLPPLFGGLHMLGIGHAIDKTTRINQLFMFIRQPWPLILVAVITSLIVQIGGFFGGFLTILWLIFFSVTLSMAVPLVAEYRMLPFQAVMTSVKVMTRHWFQVFVVYLVLFILTLLAVIPLGLGLIWMIPMFYNVKGVMYRELFGVYDPSYQPESGSGAAEDGSAKDGATEDADQIDRTRERPDDWNA